MRTSASMVAALAAVGLTPIAAMADGVGINKLKSSVQSSVDSYLSSVKTSKACNKLSAGLVYDGQVVYTRAFGTSPSDATYYWSSISKTVTGMIAMRLEETGKIRDVTKDNVWDYRTSTNWKNKMPAKCASSNMTLKDILEHRSGVPHYDKPLYSGNYLNLQFCPNKASLYSSPGYGILGEVLKAASGMGSYRSLVKEYVADRIGASTMTTREETFYSPSRAVISDIKDMSLYAIGVMNNTIVSRTTLQKMRSNGGLGWNNEGSYMSHSGANVVSGEYYRSFLKVEPDKKMAVALVSFGCNDELGGSSKADKLIGFMTAAGNPCVNNNCGGGSAPAPEPTPPSPAPGGLKNTGFDQGLTYWEKGANGAASVVSDTAKGSMVLKLDPQGATWTEEGQSIPAAPGDRYTVSGDLMIKNLSNGQAYFNVRYYDENDKPIGDTTFARTTEVRTTNGAWKHYESAVLTAPTGTKTVKARAMIRGDIYDDSTKPGPQGAVFYDNVVLTKK